MAASGGKKKIAFLSSLPGSRYLPSSSCITSPTLHLTDSSAPSQKPPQIQSLHFPPVTGNQPLIPFNPQVLQEFTTAFDNSCMSPSLTHHPHLPLNQIVFFLHGSADRRPPLAARGTPSPFPLLCTCARPGAAPAICPWDWAAPNTAALSLIQPSLFMSVIRHSPPERPARNVRETVRSAHSPSPTPPGRTRISVGKKNYSAPVSFPNKPTPSCLKCD